LNQTSIIFSLLRVKQWYKNTVIFLGIVFGGVLLSPENILISILGFIALCLLTSSCYIRNDIIDLVQDKAHPEKKNRPIASNLITIKQANYIFLILFTVAISLSFSLDLYFGILMIVLFLNSEIYSRFIKRVIILDVSSIGLNFVIRSVCGIVLIQTAISPWIIVGVFFIALFLAFLKRQSEKITLKELATLHRSVLTKYSEKMLNLSVYVTGILVILTFTGYSIFGYYSDGRLLFTVPFIVFSILRQFQLSKINHPLIQKNEFYKDKITGLLIFGFVITTLLLIYTDFYDILFNL